MDFVARAGVWLDESTLEGRCRRCDAPARLIVHETPSGPADALWCSLACWGAHHDERAQIRTGSAPLDSSPPPAWQRIVARWPRRGEPGITQTRDRRGDVLLYRDAEGALRGVLWHRVGRLGVLVSPASRRQGIGSALVRAAGRRWPIDSTQPLTEAGAALTRAALPKHLTQGSDHV